MRLTAPRFQKQVGCFDQKVVATKEGCHLCNFCDPIFFNKGRNKIGGGDKSLQKFAKVSKYMYLGNDFSLF